MGLSLKTRRFVSLFFVHSYKVINLKLKDLNKNHHFQNVKYIYHNCIDSETFDDVPHSTLFVDETNKHFPIIGITLIPQFINTGLN